MERMRIEAVVVSIGYGDYLWDTLPRNLPLLDDLVVVTSREDRETQSAAVRHGARLLTSEAHLKDGMTINKAAAINFGLGYVRRKDWLLVMDADIVMPHLARRLIESAEPHQRCIYGVDRWDVPGWIAYASWLTDTAADPGAAYLSHAPPGWRVGGRISAAGQDGWSPLGYWQLWHSSEWDTYPELPGANAEAVDLAHAHRWARPRRVLLPDWYALHLIAQGLPMGADWQGRRSARWGPPAFEGRPAGAASVTSGPGQVNPANGAQGETGQVDAGKGRTEA